MIKEQTGQGEHLVFKTEVPCWDGLGLGEVRGQVKAGWVVGGCLLSLSQLTSAALG